jgi:hypothetical protein
MVTRPISLGEGGEANNIFPLKKKRLVVVIKQVAHCAIGFALLWHIQISNKNNFLPFIGSGPSHRDVCTSLEHAHPSYAHIVSTIRPISL